MTWTLRGVPKGGEACLVYFCFKRRFFLAFFSKDVASFVFYDDALLNLPFSRMLNDSCCGQRPRIPVLTFSSSFEGGRESPCVTRMRMIN